MSRAIADSQSTTFARATSGRARRHPMFGFITLIAISYWYCLPVVSQTAFGYSEFRGYDFLLGGLILAMITRYWPQLTAFYRKDRPGKWLFRLAAWVTATTPLTVVTALSNGNAIWIPVTLIFVFHLWGFVMAYAAFRIFVRSRSDCLRLLDIFLILGTLEAVLVCLQGVGAVGRFWGERYDVYGDTISGTLGPNRTLPGHVCILVLAVALTYWRNAPVVKSRRFVLATVAAVMALLALGLTGSRTAWVASGVFGIFAVAGGRPRPGLIAGIVVAAICLLSVVPATSVDDRIESMYEGRISSRLGRVEDADVDTKFKSVDAGRLNLWIHGLGAMSDKPWALIIGSGFNNYRYVFHAGASAHNLYLTVLGELGVVGLFVYLAWLVSLWRETSAAIAGSRRLGRDRRAFVPLEMRALIAAMVVSLFAGEILYPYRPAFSFLGMFLFLCAILNHKAMVGTAEHGRASAEADRRARTNEDDVTRPHTAGQFPRWIDG